MVLFSLIAIILSGAFVAQAAPSLVTRQSITPLSNSQISAFKPYTFFASAAYCNPTTTINWSCGATCQANPGFQPAASGGDGDVTQFWFVGYDSALDEVIVSHQGTDTSKIIPILTDVDLLLTPLNPKLFPGTKGLEVHNGFESTQARSAPDVLAAVRKAMAQHNTHKVTIVGHSLGAAIALIDSVYLPLHLPSGTTFKTIGYGMPRVGNQAFANYVDAHLHVTHINNKDDPVPTLPGRSLGFVQPSGEVHIENNGEWDICPGQDNASVQCSTGAVKNVFVGNSDDHSGPYDGITMGC